MHRCPSPLPALCCLMLSNQMGSCNGGTGLFACSALRRQGNAHVLWGTDACTHMYVRRRFCKIIRYDAFANHGEAIIPRANFLSFSVLPLILKLETHATRYALCFLASNGCIIVITSLEARKLWKNYLMTFKQLHTKETQSGKI